MYSHKFSAITKIEHVYMSKQKASYWMCSINENCTLLGYYTV